ncbi:MAG: hypothetical protein OEY38_03160 [Gammaproteobacteria bacterium]|nr:hypothetical protein [Gammaproteobacteria bacterium]
MSNSNDNSDQGNSQSDNPVSEASVPPLEPVVAPKTLMNRITDSVFESISDYLKRYLVPVVLGTALITIVSLVTDRMNDDNLTKKILTDVQATIAEFQPDEDNTSYAEEEILELKLELEKVHAELAKVSDQLRNVNHINSKVSRMEKNSKNQASLDKTTNELILERLRNLDLKIQNQDTRILAALSNDSEQRKVNSMKQLVDNLDAVVQKQQVLSEAVGDSN